MDHLYCREHSFPNYGFLRWLLLLSTGNVLCFSVKGLYRIEYHKIEFEDLSFNRQRGSSEVVRSSEVADHTQRAFIRYITLPTCKIHCVKSSRQFIPLDCAKLSCEICLLSNLYRPTCGSRLALTYLTNLASPSEFMLLTLPDAPLVPYALWGEQHKCWLRTSKARGDIIRA